MNVHEAVSRFRSAAIQKGSEGGARDDELYRELCASYSAIMSLGPPGEAAFRNLLKDPSPEVRVWVAAQLLAVGNPECESVLEILSQDSGLLGFDAKTTLVEYRAGRLQPPLSEPAA